MRTRFGRNAVLGELIVAAFDVAAQYGTDPREVSRLAAAAVMNVLTAAENDQVVGLLAPWAASGSCRRRSRPPAGSALPADAGGGAGR